MIETSRFELPWNADYGSRIFPVGDMRPCRLHCAITVVGRPFEHASGMIFLSRFITHLRVIDRQLLIEHYDVLMLTQRHTVGVQVPAYTVFHPHEVVFPQVGLRADQFCGEHPLCEQDDGAVRLRDSPVLLPQGGERNPSVPFGCLVFAVQHPIGQVGNYRIDAAVCHQAHSLQAVHVIYSVRLDHSLCCRF